MFKNLTLVLTSIILSLFLADWVLGRLAMGPSYLRALTMGVSYDTRSKLEVVQDYRTEDSNWYPSVTALTYIKHPLIVEGQRVIPLGGVSNAKVVVCNEGGFYSTFSTDNAGFHNPPGTWPIKQAPNIFLVGDSFTYGDCVKEGEDVASQMRKRFTSVINLSNRGNGPLQELATIREYVPPGRVDQLFWVFYERNDLLEVNRGKEDSILIRYLEGDFSQDLWQRQQQINLEISNYTEELIQKELQTEAGQRFQLFIHLREAINQYIKKIAAADSNAQARRKPIPGKFSTDKQESPDFELFKNIMTRAKQEVEQKGGEFVFVYLPSYRRFSGETLSPWANHKEAVMDIMKNLGVKIIDLEPYFHQQEDPLALFPLGLNGHYNALGYSLVAKVLSEHLEAVGYPTYDDQ